MKVEDFVEASANMRVLEKKMLDNAAMIRISEASSAMEALRLISQSSEYDFSSLKRVEDYENVLKSGLKATYSLLYKFSPHREIVDIPASKYDFHNLKVALKSKYTNRSMGYLYSDITDLESKDIEAYVLNGENGEVLPEYVLNALKDAENSYTESKDPQQIDIVIDRHFYAHLIRLCEKIQSDFITEYIKLSIDFYNIKTLMRVKNMHKGTRFLNECFIPAGLTDTEFFLVNYDKSPDMIASVFYYKYFGDIINKGIESYNKTGNYSNLEKLFDDCLIEYTKKSKYIAFGPEVLFAYILSKENEARQIRILVTCKNNNIRSEILKERLRDNYA